MLLQQQQLGPPRVRATRCVAYRITKANTARAKGNSICNLVSRAAPASALAGLAVGYVAMSQPMDIMHEPMAATLAEAKLEASSKHQVNMDLTKSKGVTLAGGASLDGQAPPVSDAPAAVTTRAVPAGVLALHMPEYWEIREWLRTAAYAQVFVSFGLVVYTFVRLFQKE